MHRPADPKGLLALALVAGAVIPASAADIALVIDNQSLSSSQATALSDGLEAAGYDVISRGGSRAELAEAFSDAAGRIDGDGRLMLLWFGETRASGNETWLLPEDFEGSTVADAEFGAISLSLLTEMAAALPGRSAVIIGLPAAEGDVGDLGPMALRAGIAAGDPPQGVLLVSGAAGSVVDAVTRGLLSENSTAAQAVARFDEGVFASGFASPDFGFGAPSAGIEESGAAEEEIETPVVDEQVSPEQAVEDALALDQPTRRRVQRQLSILGYDPRGIDGVFGPGTRSALREWQSGRSLGGDGYLSESQLSRLEEEADARSAELAEAAERARREEEAADAAFWQTTGANGSAADFRAYLGRYPDGIYADEARDELERRDAMARDSAQAEDRAAWDVAVAAGDVASYRKYLDARPDGAFAGEARARIAALKSEPDRKKAEKAAAETEKNLGLNKASRALIESQLGALGFDAGDPDGKFDKATRRALREFQTRQGLPVTGHVDARLVQALIVSSLGLQ